MANAEAATLTPPTDASTPLPGVLLVTLASTTGEQLPLLLRSLAQAFTGQSVLVVAPDVPALEEDLGSNLTLLPPGDGPSLVSSWLLTPAERSLLRLSRGSVTGLALLSASSEAVREAVWLRQLLESIDVATDGSCTSLDTSAPTRIFIDNQGALSAIKSGVIKSKTRHIEVKFHYVHDQQRDKGKVEFLYVPSADNFADIMTKSLAGPKHAEMTSRMGITDEKDFPSEAKS